MDDRSATSVGARLRAARSAAALSARELDRLAQRAEGQCALLEAREQQSLRGDIARSYASVLGLSPAWLLLGEGEMPAEETIRAAVEHARAAQRVAHEVAPSPTHGPGEG